MRNPSGLTSQLHMGAASWMFAEREYGGSGVPLLPLCAHPGVGPGRQGFQWSNSLFLGTMSFQDTFPCFLKHKQPGLWGQVGLGVFVC